MTDIHTVILAIIKAHYLCDCIPAVPDPFAIENDRTHHLADMVTEALNGLL